MRGKRSLSLRSGRSQTKIRKRRFINKPKHDALWKKKQSLIEKYLTVKNYSRNNNHFVTFNQISLVPGGFDTDDEINQLHFNSTVDRYTPTYREDENRVNYFRSESFEKMSPNFDNHVLGSDPFRRRKQGTTKIQLDLLSPSSKVINNNFVNHPENLNNLLRFKQNSDALNQASLNSQGIHNTSIQNIINRSPEKSEIQLKSKNNIESFKTISRPSLSSTEVDFSRDVSALNQLKQMEESLYKKLGFK